MSALTITNLRVEVSGRGPSREIVDDVDLTIGFGQVLGLVGESGAGKTTVGLAALGHTRNGTEIRRGTVLVDGQPVLRLDRRRLRALRGRLISHVPQDPSAALNPALRIGSQIRDVLEDHDFGGSSESRRSRAAEVLGEVELSATPEFLRRYPHQLSGGEQQRVALAMAFACRPSVIVLDEPTTGLDVATRSRVIDTIRHLCAGRQVACLYISHDLAVVATLADRVAVMRAGRIVEEGATSKIFSDHAHPYTRSLLAATPGPSARRATVRMAVPTSTEAPRTDGPLLSVVDVHAGYRGVEVLHGVSLDVDRGECVAVVGASGCGKSTLARSIGGLLGEWTGEIRLDGDTLGRSVRERTPEQRLAVQTVFQNPSQSLNPRQTVGESVSRPLRVRGASKSEAARSVEAMLERVALDRSFANRRPDELSGGEQQRAALARALVSKPQLLICDEVTSALDSVVQAAIIDLLVGLQRELALSMIFITHDLALVREVARRVAVMAHGRIVELGSTDMVLTRAENASTAPRRAGIPAIVPRSPDADRG